MPEKKFDCHTGKLRPRTVALQMRCTGFRGPQNIGRKDRETERGSNSNLLAWQRPGAGDLHTMQGAHGSRQ